MCRSCRFIMGLVAVIAIGGILMAQRGPGRGFGRGPGGNPAGRGPGIHAQDDRHDEDHEVFRFLVANHEKIQREVEELPNGVRTLTESDDKDVAAQIKEHVYWMKHRIENTQPIRMRDPLFAELFRHTDTIRMEFEETEHGVRVTETSDDPWTAKLIQAHAVVVSAFVKHGFSEMMKNHALPDKPVTTTSEFEFPTIPEYGKVVRLPDATQQPRAGSRIVVDLTQGGAADALNPGIEKVARFVNIYAGAGQEPASVSIAVVLHGDATLAALNPEAYAARFGTKGNPSLELMHQLHEAGVEFYVCGQSLVQKSAAPEDAVVFVDVAVSALTTLVNLQSEDYRYIQLR